VQRSKTPPKGAAIFVANCLARDPHLLDEHRGGELVAERLGVADTDAVYKLITEVGASRDGRAPGDHCGTVGLRRRKSARQGCRRSSGGWPDFAKSSDYLKWLAGNGYPLAPRPPSTYAA
jgi:ParB family chromosome partitioning protein